MKTSEITEPNGDPISISNRYTNVRGEFINVLFILTYIEFEAIFQEGEEVADEKRTDTCLSQYIFHAHTCWLERDMGKRPTTSKEIRIQPGGGGGTKLNGVFDRIQGLEVGHFFELSVEVLGQLVRGGEET